MNEDISKIKFDESGLITAIIQEESGQVLSLVRMNKMALIKTLETKYVHFYSTETDEVCQNGAKTGNTQKIQAVYYNCSGDAILIKVHQSGVACHTGTYSCFSGRKLGSDRNLPVVVDKTFEENLSVILHEIYSVIREQQRHLVDGSHTYIFNLEHDEILRKIGNKNIESVIASKNNTNPEILRAMSDLWYYCLALLAWHDIEPEELFNELMERRKENAYNTFTDKNEK